MIFKSIFVQPKYPPNLQRLYELACNLWTIWNYDAVGLFYRIDTQLFREVNHSPLKFLYSLTKEKLEALSRDKGFLFELGKVWEKFQHYIQHTGTYKDECNVECDFKKNEIIAYFSMEYGLHESIPIYAGGLGVLAGDFLKGVSDLDIPIVGFGLLYRYGYFTQYVDPNSYQREVFMPFDSHLLPIKELRDPQANRAFVSVRTLGEEVKVKLWEISIGKARLILLDTDIEENPPNLRDITGELYTSNREKRMQQELILGIGGVKALDVLGIRPTLYHLNEGHTAFVVIGRLQDLMGNKKLSFSEAKAVIRASTIFTTHTPVIAGNENMPVDLVEKYLQPELKEIGLAFKQIAPLGYMNRETDLFWLPAFAIRFSKYINGVSKQHAAVSRKVWSGLFTGQSILEVPITYVTNGVHLSWISPSFVDMFNRYIGPDYVHCGDRTNIWKNIYNIPDYELWEEHRRNKKDLVNFIRRHLARRMAAKGYSHVTQRLFNPDYLTIVFARRFAAYKRPTLILKDKERLRRILTDPAEPMQIIFAGKAHPADEYSKRMIKEIIDFAKDYHVEDRVVFLENYDINVARHLYWGADVWLNTPAQNMEASGTSGIKAAMNGALHLSTFEGWWQEGYNGANGWAITAGLLYDRPDLQDAADANQLYDFLEYEMTALYYDRNEADIPETWVRMMKDSLFSICQNFSMNRVLCNYLRKIYAPAKKNLERVLGGEYKLLKEAVQEEKDVLKYFDKVRLVSFKTNIDAKERLTKGEQVEVKCGVQFEDAPPKLFSVELFYMLDGASKFKIVPMQPQSEEGAVVLYQCLFEIEGYGIQNINVRVKPANEIVQDLHPELIKWKD